MGQCNCIDRGKEKKESNMEKQRFRSSNNIQTGRDLSRDHEYYDQMYNEYKRTNNSYVYNRNNSHISLNTSNRTTGSQYNFNQHNQNNNNNLLNNNSFIHIQQQQQQQQGIGMGSYRSYDKLQNPGSNHQYDESSFFETKNKIKIIFLKKQEVISFLNSCKHYIDERILPTYIIPHPLYQQDVIVVFQSADLISRKNSENLSSYTVNFEKKTLNLSSESDNYQKIAQLLNSIDDNYTYLGYYTNVMQSSTELNLIFYSSTERKSRSTLKVMGSSKLASNVKDNKLYFEVQMIQSLDSENIDKVVNERLIQGNSLIKGMITLQFMNKKDDTKLLLFEKFDQSYQNLMVTELNGELFLNKNNQSQDLSEKIDQICLQDDLCFAGMLTNFDNSSISVIIANENIV